VGVVTSDVETFVINRETYNLSLWTESSTYLMGWECCVGLDVPLRAPDLGNRVHVPNLMARILARADRVYRLGGARGLAR